MNWTIFEISKRNIVPSIRHFAIFAAFAWLLRLGSYTDSDCGTPCSRA